MFTIDVASLEPGIHQYESDLEPEDLELDPDKFKEVHVHARLDVSERRIMVSLDARATAGLQCDRTLRLFDQEIGGTFHILFAPPAFATEDDDAFDEVRPLDPGDQEIDLTDVTRDTIILAVPQRCVAPGAEEEDIPTEFGAPEDDGEAIDPRWNALKELKSSANSN